MSLQETEAECAAGRTAPRVSLADIERNIDTVLYFSGADAAQAFGATKGYPASFEVLTICLVALHNGFTIIGKSAPASPENFNEALGRKLAYEDAVRHVWPLMGYELRERLYRGEN